jgi:CO/xanthine dehydrogenase Mo-binding subunit
MKSLAMPIAGVSLFASVLSLPGHRIRLTCPDVGGGFGIKLHFYADEVAAAAMAMLLGIPIKYVADRAESFVSDVHAREHLVRARLAVKKDGRFQAVIDRISDRIVE